MTAPGTGDATPADDVGEIDPGLARERTSLAWTRTAISFAAWAYTVTLVSAVALAMVLLGGGSPPR